MKLLTLNTHSLIEENYPEKLESFVTAIAHEQPDIIALQEVNQSISACQVPACKLKGFTPCGRIPVKADNHAYNTVKILSERGIDYRWTWLGIKEGYGKFEEGIAILSMGEIIETDILTVSRINDRRNWKTRRILGIHTDGQWFYSVHLGWWNDEDEPFREQWKKLCGHLSRGGRIWLMGDFNSPAHVKGEGYDMIKDDGWYDTFALANEKDSGITAEKNIDGWKERTSPQGMRIDHIWCNERVEITSSQVIFNGRNHPVISDHYGVIIKTKE